MMPLSELYRPRLWSEFRGNDAVVRRLRTYIRLGSLHPAALFCGPTGIGKTTLARIAASELGCDLEWGTFLINGHDCTIEMVSEIERRLPLCPMMGGYQTWIVEEAHSMSKQAAEGWKFVLEHVPLGRCVMFTTTEARWVEANKPITHRMRQFFLETPPDAVIAAHVRAVAEAEGFPEIDADAVAREADGSFRQALAIVEDRMVMAVSDAVGGGQ